jgi:uncharacterized membrane protein
MRQKEFTASKSEEMMSTEMIQILVANYSDTAAAEAKLKAVKMAQQDQGIDIIDAAVVKRDTNNKLHIHETADVTGGRGAAVGGVFGGVLGLIAGPGGLVVGAALGAVIGGAAAKVFDTGIPHKRLEEIGKALQPGSAALVVLAPQGFAPFVQDLIQAPGVELAVESMNPQAAQQLGHDHDVALKALTMGESLADGGMTSATEDKPTL